MAYLLLKGELPTKNRLEAFSHNITYHTLIHEDIRLMFRAFPLGAHPMAILSSVMGALSTFYPDSLDPNDPEQVRVSIHRIMAKMATIAAYSYKYSIGHPFSYPQNRLSYAGNILNMMFATPAETFEVDPVLERAVDVLLILHADHEQNCSTSTMRLVGSSDANIYASASAGDQRAVGTAARRGQPGRDRDARRHPGQHNGDDGTSTSRWPRTRATTSA